MSATPAEPSDVLVARIEGWLSKEGYPLEFRTANEFRRAGLSVRQGRYVRRRDDNDVAREIDVAASVDTLADSQNQRPLLRAYYIAECKWTPDKPWVVFSQPESIAQAACVCQTIGTGLGRAIMWARAGDNQFARLRQFEAPSRPGFSGRQVLGNKDNVDAFYNAMRSVTTLATNLCEWYDEGRVPGRMPEYGVVAFPIVVIDGRLFEAWFDVSLGRLRVEERKQMRLHWKGAPNWSHHATVDIVVADHLPEFLVGRRQELSCLLTVMRETADEIARCFESATLDQLSVTEGGRGIVGLPPLLCEILRMQRGNNPQQNAES